MQLLRSRPVIALACAHRCQSCGCQLLADARTRFRPLCAEQRQTNNFFGKLLMWTTFIGVAFVRSTKDLEQYKELLKEARAACCVAGRCIARLACADPRPATLCCNRRPSTTSSGPPRGRAWTAPRRRRSREGAAAAALARARFCAASRRVVCDSSRLTRLASRACLRRSRAAAPCSALQPAALLAAHDALPTSTATPPLPLPVLPATARMPA